MIIFILSFVIVALAIWLALSIASVNKANETINELRLLRDHAESRMRICEQAGDELHEDYTALAKECEELRERVAAAESKLSRKGCGKKGSKKS